MAKFNFKFETLKRVKQILEKKAQKELSLIEKKIFKAETEKNEIIKLRSDTKTELKSGKKRTIANMQFYEDYDKFLEEQINQKNIELEEFEKEKQEKLKVLTVKSKEKKIFETLEEKMFETFQMEERKIDQKFMDEIGTMKFNREKD